MMLETQAQTYFQRLDLSSKSVSFVEAIKDKYVEQEEIDNQFILPKDRKISTDITFVGFGEVSSIQKQLHHLTSIDLSGRSIQIAGDLEEVSGCLHRVRVLNLADNDLTWTEVIKIVAIIPNLKDIVLTSNKLNDVTDIVYPRKPYKSLLSLTLGRLNLHWSCLVNVLASIWFKIEHIDLWDSHLTNSSFSPPVLDGFVDKVVSLCLSQNNLTNLSWLEYIGSTRSMCHLDLSRCELEDIELTTIIRTQLENLTSLNISYNLIRSWKPFACLNSLPALTHLICNENPVFSSEKSAKSLVVARISKLKVLNREEISRQFRRDAEILYLRKEYKDYLAREHREAQEFQLEHPRYEELIKLYGRPEDLNSIQVVEKYITVDLCFADKMISKKLPCDMRVSNLQMLCKRLFKLRSSTTLEIICEEKSESGDLISYPLDKEGQTLHFFSVKNGHKLLIKANALA